MEFFKGIRQAGRKDMLAVRARVQIVDKSQLTGCRNLCLVLSVKAPNQKYRSNVVQVYDLGDCLEKCAAFLVRLQVGI
jgi:hypothetical protein